MSRIGYFHKKVLLVGEPDKRFPVDEIFQDIGRTKEYVGTVKVEKRKWHWVDGENTSNNEIENISSLMYRHHVGEVIIFLSDKFESDDIYQIVSFCLENAIGYYIIPDISLLPLKYPWNEKFSFIPFIDRRQTKRDSLMLISVKRFADIFISLIGLFLFFPFWMIISVLIKVEDRGPALYTSKRIGKNGKTIRFYKFRSMIADAEKRKKELLKFNERTDGPLFKMSNDPRVTKIGKILRKYSIDEVPQFLNVLKGDMSLIGPRPHLPDEVKEYSDKDIFRLECMPGISCLPQIIGRNTISFREWIDLDLLYRKNWTLSLDSKILGQSIKIALSSFLPNENHEKGV